MNKFKVIVVDDEVLARQGAALLLRQDPEIEIVGECDNGRSALAEIRAQRPDLVLLDIQMPHSGGLEVLEQLEGKERPAVIFITAYDQHAVRAFELCAVDYLLKPFRDQRFHVAVARAKEQVRRSGYRDVQIQAQSLINHLRRLESPATGNARREPDETSSSRLVFKVEGEHVFVEQRDIAWIEAQGDFIRLCLGDRFLAVRESLQNVEKRLDGAIFVRVHRSFIVNVASISKITPALYGDHVILTHDGAKLRLSRTYRNQLKRLLASPPR